MAMRVGESFSGAVDVFRRHPVEWILMGVVVSLVGGVIPILGALLLLPGVVREGRASLAQNRAPQVGNLFNGIGNDIGPMLLYGLAQMIGSLFCFIGGPIAWILFWYSVELAADGRVAPPDALAASKAWVMKNLGDTILMAFACTLFASIALTLTCGLAIFIVAPYIHIVWILHWNSIRDQVYEVAASEGIQVAPE